MFAHNEQLIHSINVCMYVLFLGLGRELYSLTQRRDPRAADCRSPGFANNLLTWFLAHLLAYLRALPAPRRARRPLASGDQARTEMPRPHKCTSGTTTITRTGPYADPPDAYELPTPNSGCPAACRLRPKVTEDHEIPLETGRRPYRPSPFE